MASKSIKTRKRAPNKAKVEDLNTQQQMFVLHLLASEDYNGSEAAKKAGYANPAKAAHQLLQNPTINAVIGRVKQKRQDKLELKAESVLECLRFGLYFNPLDYFQPCGEDGTWMIDDPTKIPPEVGRLIDSIELRTERSRDGSERKFYAIRLGAHGNDLLPTAMKHLNLDGVDKIAVSVVPGLDWDKLYERQQKKDPLEFAIEHGIPETPKLEYTEAELVDYDENDLDTEQDNADSQSTST